MAKKRLEWEFSEFLYPAFYNNKKYTCIAAGRRTGKTYQAAMWILTQLLTQQKTGLWVDTVQTNLHNYIERYFQPLMGFLWKRVKYDKQKIKLVLPSKSYLDFRSAEKPQSMEGFEYDYVVLNEAGIILKKKELWKNTIQPMCKNAEVKIVGTPKGKNYFYELFTEMPRISPNEWASFKFSAYDSPFWETEALEELRRTASTDVWQQEYLGEFVEGVTFAIITRTFKESYRGDDDVPYLWSTPWIKKQLSERGYWWVGLDGGMNSSCSAAVIGYHNEKEVRDIIVKEIYSESPHEDLTEISFRIKEFFEYHGINLNDVNFYGDPAIAAYKDNEAVLSITGQQVNMLDRFRKPNLPTSLKGIYINRKSARLGVLRRELGSLRSDHKPSIIILKGEKQRGPRTKDFGCPCLFQGLWEGFYKFEEKNGVISSDLEQIHPITDLCDAFSYYLLETRPLPELNESNKKHFPILW